MVTIMRNLPKSSQPVSIAFLLLPQFSNLCLSNALEPLRAANGYATRRAYNWQFVSLDGKPVRSSSGMAVMPDCALAELATVDRFYVIASYGHLDADTPDLRRALRFAARRAGQVFGLDTGAWHMAAAGLLNGRKATVHWDVLEAFSERFLDVQVVQALWVEDGDMLTCAGASATVDLSRHLIAKDISPAIALDVEALFTPPVQQDATQSPHSLLSRATRVMRDHLEAPLPLADLAVRLNTSPRTLSRRCEANLGLSPGQLYRHIRLSAARQLVEGSALSVSEIAIRCGYDNPSAMTRAFRQRFGAPPRAFRGETASKLT